MSTYIGDFAEDFATLEFMFTSRRFSTGVPYTLAGTPSLAVYATGSLTQSTAGVTLTVDYDGVTGLNHVLIDLSADAFYATGKDYEVVVAAGTIDSVSVVGEVVAKFSIQNRYSSAQLAAIVADTNELQTDWANGGRLDLILDTVNLWAQRNAVILSGLVTGAGTGTEVFTISALGITATVTVDSSGNRSALVWS